MGRVEGKVALITGAARGQGRHHAVRLAEVKQRASRIALSETAVDGVPCQSVSLDSADFGHYEVHYDPAAGYRH